MAREDRQERRQARREFRKERRQEFFGIEPEGTTKENFIEFLRRVDDDKLREMGFTDVEIRRIKLRRGTAKTLLTIGVVFGLASIGFGIPALVAKVGAAKAGAAATATATATGGALAATNQGDTRFDSPAGDGLSLLGDASSGNVSDAGQGDDRFDALGQGSDSGNLSEDMAGTDAGGEQKSGVGAKVAALGAKVGFGKKLLDFVGNRSGSGKDRVLRPGSFSGRTLENLGLGEKAARAARAGILYKPSQFEKDYQDLIKERAKRLRAEQRQLAKLRGGLTEGQRARLLADRNVIAAAANERMAQLARGGNFMAGQSGVQEQAKRDLQRQNLEAQRKLVSDVRQADIDALERRIERFRQDEAMQEQRVLLAGKMADERKRLAVQELRPTQKSQPLTIVTNTPTGGSDSREALKTTIPAT